MAQDSSRATTEPRVVAGPVAAPAKASDLAQDDAAPQPPALAPASNRRARRGAIATAVATAALLGGAAFFWARKAPMPVAASGVASGASVAGGAAASVRTAAAVVGGSTAGSGTAAAGAGFPGGPGARPAVARDAQKARELVGKAQEWQLNGDTGTARDLLEQAVQLDPDNAEAHYRLGALFLNSQPDRARAEYEASRRINPQKYGDIVQGILNNL
jgi:tetratricopeptide (TPR) repeat protein